jgi:hypothetical protein
MEEKKWEKQNRQRGEGKLYGLQEEQAERGKYTRRGGWANTARKNR